MPPFLVMRRHTTYGDYPVLFDLLPNMDLKTYNPGSHFRLEEANQYLRKTGDCDVDEYVVMVL